MFPPNPLINELLKSCLAKAQRHHRVTVSHLLAEATHIHMILYVTNPDAVKGFMERFKTESAHAINRLLGRRKRTLWCEGYDSPVILDVGAAVKRIVYLYSNPTKDGLVDNIDVYPGLNSWRLFRDGGGGFTGHKFPRDAVQSLPTGVVRRELYYREARRLRQGRDELEFKIEPNAWMKAFKIEPSEQQQMNEMIVALLREKEQQCREKRAKGNKTVVGANRLEQYKPGSPYERSVRGKRTYCVASNKKRRIKFLANIKAMIGQAREALRQWQAGIIGIKFPLGLYAPSMPKLAEALGGVGFVVG